MSGKLNLLLVDDDKDILNSLKELFLSEGHSVQLAENGRDAVSLLEADSNFDLILLDFRMPSMNGDEFCAWHRERNISVPILVISADLNAGKLNGFESVKGVLRKPFELDGILGAVSKCVMH
jgi:CheY-like chemotaxis protein